MSDLSIVLKLVDKLFSVTESFTKNIEYTEKLEKRVKELENAVDAMATEIEQSKAFSTFGADEIALWKELMNCSTFGDDGNKMLSVEQAKRLSNALYNYRMNRDVKTST